MKRIPAHFWFLALVIVWGAIRFYVAGVSLTEMYLEQIVMLLMAIFCVEPFLKDKGGLK